MGRSSPSSARRRARAGGIQRERLIGREVAGREPRQQQRRRRHDEDEQQREAETPEQIASHSVL